MTRPFRRSAAIGLCVLMLFWIANPIASADDTPAPPSSNNLPTVTTSYTTSPEDFSLTVSPTRLNIGQADIGTVQTVLVINRGQQPTTVTAQKRGFTAAADGSLTYLPDAPYSAFDWVTLSPTTFTLESGQSQTVTATVTVPSDADLGDHQVAITFLVPAGQTDANIKINRGISLPVFITVPGPTDDSVALSNLIAPGFAISGPVAVTATIQNVGTVHRDFRAATALKVDSAGSPSVFPDFTVPRSSTRDITTTWNPPLMCICHPSVTMTNADGSVQRASIRVIVFPVYWVAILIVAGLLVFFGIRLSRRRYRANVVSAAHSLNRPDIRGDA